MFQLLVLVWLGSIKKENTMTRKMGQKYCWVEECGGIGTDRSEGGMMMLESSAPVLGKMHLVSGEMANIIEQSSCGEWLIFLRGQNDLKIFCTFFARFMYFTFSPPQELRTFEWSRAVFDSRWELGLHPMGFLGSTSASIAQW